jgi:hypothetical protein
MWKQAENQMDSTQMLLQEMEDEADILQIETVEGVTALAWGLRKVALHLSDQVVEVAIDATCE